MISTESPEIERLTPAGPDIIIPASARSEFLRRLAWLMLLRVGVITILLGATLALNYKSIEDLRTPSSVFLLTTVIFTYVLTIIYAAWHLTGRAAEILAKVQFAVDLVTWTALVYATGGPSSGFTFLYHISVITAAIIFGQQGAIVVAGSSSIMLLLLEGAMFGGVLTPLADQVSLPEITIAELFYYSGVNVVALFLVASLAGNLAGKLEEAGAGLEAERRRSADLAALHENIVRSLTNGLATTGNDLLIRSVNPVGLDLLKSEEDELLGMSLEDFIPEATEACRGSDLPLKGKGRLVRMDGMSLPVEFNVDALSDAQGERLGYIVVFQDISVVASMEERLERARHLAALGELAASLAHEIRNPLGSISGAVEMIQEEEQISGSSRGLLDMAGKELSRINTLIGQLLSYAKPQSMQIGRIDMVHMIEEVISAFNQSKEGSRVNVEFHAHDQIHIEADAAQLKQVMSNLFLNAAQHSEKGQDVKIVAAEIENGGIRIEVIDRGRGIKKEDADKIFDPFFTTKERGVGLGLALCKRVVENHGGTISVENNPGGGSRFWFTLPETPPEDGSIPRQWI